MEVSILAYSSCCRFIVGIIAFIYICFFCFALFGVIFFVSSELHIDLFISHVPSIILCSINLSCLLFDLFLLLVIESNCRSCLDILLNCLWKTWNRSFCAVSGKRLLLLIISEHSWVTYFAETNLGNTTNRATNVSEIYQAERNWDK